LRTYARQAAFGTAGLLPHTHPTCLTMLPSLSAALGRARGSDWAPRHTSSSAFADRLCTSSQPIRMRELDPPSAPATTPIHRSSNAIRS